MPTFENDVFISYAHIDNRALVEGENGWIDKFHYALATRLSQVLGEESKIWRDPKIQGNDFLTDTIRAALPRSAALLSVLSPRYLKSNSCLEELKEFLKVAEQTGGVRLRDKSRIFIVIKTDILLDEHPPELRELLGYKFYRRDSKTGRPHELMVDEKDAQFVLYLDDLTYDIAEILGLIRPRARTTGQAHGMPTDQTVYLAETTSDVEETRDQIRRELRDRGYKILPDRSFPANGKAYAEMVRAALKQCTLSIHCIGQHYGTVPEGIEQSLVHLQIEAAESCSRDRPLTRLLLVSPDLKAAEPRQEEFLGYLRTKIASQGAELVEANIEKFKDIVQEKLAVLSKKSTGFPTRSNGKSRIYLMCHQRDFNEVRMLQQHLYRQGLEVVLPATEGDEAQVQDDHKENLIWCDAAMIYYGNGNEPWFRTKLRDLDKAFGHGRQKNWLAKAVYLAPPRTEPKETLLSHEALVIRGFESFSPDSLDPFVAQLKKKP
jgi:hypothetical protein